MWRSGRRSPRRCACLPSLLRRPFVPTPVILCRSRHRHAPLVPPPDESPRLERIQPGPVPCLALPRLLRRRPRHAVLTSTTAWQVLEYPLLVSSTGPFREVLAYFPQFLQEVVKSKQAAWYARFQIHRSIPALVDAMRARGEPKRGGGNPLLDSTPAPPDARAGSITSEACCPRERSHCSSSSSIGPAMFSTSLSTQRTTALAGTLSWRQPKLCAPLGICMHP